MLRFSISSTRDMNINDLQIALINYIVSQQKNSQFIIRIADTEDENQKNKEQEWIDILKKFAINTENTINQSKNLNIYQHLASNLVKENKAYICFCNKDKCIQNCASLSGEEIKKRVQNKEKYTIKLNTPNNTINYDDIIYGNILVEPKEIGSIDILKQDGTATYNFATAIDDMSNGITTVIQSQKMIKETAKQIYIQKLLAYNFQIKYAHIPEVLKDKYSIKWLLQEGFLPDAIINYIIKINNRDKKNIFYLPEAIEFFELNKVPKDNTTFNIEKLKELNREHLLAMDSKKLSKIFGFADSDIGEILKVYLEKNSTIKELDKKIVKIFSAKNCTQDMEKIMQIVKKAPMLNSFEEFKNYIIKNCSLNNEKVIKALNLLILGEEDSNKLDKIYPFIKPYLLEVVKCR